MEEYHKSLKSNASLAKSPTKTSKDAEQPCLGGDLGVLVKLERMKMATKMNHFALCVLGCISKPFKQPSRSCKAYGWPVLNLVRA